MATTALDWLPHVHRVQLDTPARQKTPQRTGTPVLKERIPLQDSNRVHPAHRESNDF